MSAGVSFWCLQLKNPSWCTMSPTWTAWRCLEFAQWVLTWQAHLEKKGVRAELRMASSNPVIPFSWQGVVCTVELMSFFLYLCIHPMLCCFFLHRDNTPKWGALGGKKLLLQWVSEGVIKPSGSSKTLQQKWLTCRFAKTQCGIWELKFSSEESARWEKYTLITAVIRI